MKTPFKEAVIHYENANPRLTSMLLYLKEYGKRSAQDIMQAHIITDQDWVYVYNLALNQGRKGNSPTNSISKSKVI